MGQVTWDETFINLSNEIAKRSKDQNTKLGTVIVGPDNEIRATGYNSFPRGINDNIQERQERPYKYKWFEHAERNAIYNAARVGIPLKGCRLYCRWHPCSDCARAIIQVGIIEVIVEELIIEGRDDWNDDMKVAYQLLLEAGVTIRTPNDNNPITRIPRND